MAASKREKFVDWVLSKEGRPYCWPTEENRYSGKGLPGAKYVDVYDCSGLITAGIHFATASKVDWRATHNCRKLMAECRKLSIKLGEQPEVGDLAFYGPGQNAPTHVMIYCADGKVFGAGRGGGPDITSPLLAAKRGARVAYRDKATYRPDFIGFWKLPL